VTTNTIAILVIVACIAALVIVFRTPGHKRVERERAESRDPWDYS